MPGLQVWSLARERARGNRSMFLSLSFSLPPPVSRINKKEKNIFKNWFKGPEVTHEESSQDCYSVLPFLYVVTSWKMGPYTVQLVHFLICSPSCSCMDLKAIFSSLSDFAPLSFAESWDNVGFLGEPSPPHTVNTPFLTNDFTKEVMQEVLQKKADCILSDHLPIFPPMKLITWKTWKEYIDLDSGEQSHYLPSSHSLCCCTAGSQQLVWLKGLEFAPPGPHILPKHLTTQ